MFSRSKNTFENFHLRINYFYIILDYFDLLLLKKIYFNYFQEKYIFKNNCYCDIKNYLIRCLLTTNSILKKNGKVKTKSKVKKHGMKL